MTRLCQQATTRVTDLFKLYDLLLNAVSKHVKALERAGFVRLKPVVSHHWLEVNLDQNALIESELKTLTSVWTLRLEKLSELMNEGDNNN